MPVSSDDVQRHSVHTLVFRSLKRTHDMFLIDQGQLPPTDEHIEKLRFRIKSVDQYGPVLNIVAQNKRIAAQRQEMSDLDETASNSGMDSMPPSPSPMAINTLSRADITPTPTPPPQSMALVASGLAGTGASGSQHALIPRRAPTMPRPKWHAPWKLARVISGHLGWVRCVAVEPANEWFATGSNDRVIKIWDLASGQLKLSLTGHVSAVRGLAVSPRHPYLFSCGEDKQVKCWDLEYNKV
ncbi:unnamed protein product, partial [Meganyctiphanes norvegica]